MPIQSTLFRFAATLCLVAPTALQAARTLEYQWLTAGEPSGKQTVHIEDNRRVIEFSFNDRGRGPETRTTVTLNEAGLPVEFRSTGANYYKGEVDEHFVMRDGRASWRSAIEEMAMDIDAPGFYLAESWPPEYTAILARAILRDDDGKLPLLPAGTAGIEAVEQQEIAAPGGSQTITLYAISGLGAMPRHVWLDADLELFGIDNNWFALVPVGQIQHAGLLKERQERHRDAWIRDFSAHITEPSEGLLAIRNARLFDPGTGTVAPGSTVFIHDGRITAIYEQASNEVSGMPAEARVIDAAGRFLMPALWDMHAHIRPQNYFNYLAQGVTNVRDMANDPDYIIGARRAIAAGEIAAPDIHPLGFIDFKGPYSAPTGMLADTLPQAKSFVDYYARRGFLGAKLYSSLPVDWVEPLAAYAHGRGLEVMGHIPSGMSAADAVAAGFDEITHINMVLLNFLNPHEIDTRSTKRFTEVGLRAGGIDLQSEAVSEFIDTLVKNGTRVDPTLSIFIDMFRNTPGQPSIVFRDIAGHLPVLLRRQVISTPGFNAGHERAFAKAAGKTMALVRLLHERGVQLLPGTDNMLPGMTLIRELRFYQQAGIPAAEVLRMATLDAATAAGKGHELGSIAPGRRAHLILVGGNPLQDIADLHKVSLVIKDRAIYHPDRILTRLGFVPFTH